MTGVAAHRIRRTNLQSCGEPKVAENLVRCEAGAPEGIAGNVVRRDEERSQPINPP